MTMITKKQLMNMIEEEIIKEFQIQKSIIEKIDDIY